MAGLEREPTLTPAGGEAVGPAALLPEVAEGTGADAPPAPPKPKAAKPKKPKKQGPEPHIEAGAVTYALDGTELLREQVERLDLLPTDGVREEYARKMLRQKRQQAMDPQAAARSGHAPQQQQQQQQQLDASDGASSASGSQLLQQPVPPGASPRAAAAAAARRRRRPSVPQVRQSGGLALETAALLNQVDVEKIKDLEAQQVALEVHRQELEVQAQAWGAQQAVRAAAGKEAVRKTLAEALQEDRELSQLPPKQALAAMRQAKERVQELNQEQDAAHKGVHEVLLPLYRRRRVSAGGSTLPGLRGGRAVSFGGEDAQDDTERPSGGSNVADGRYSGDGGGGGATYELAIAARPTGGEGRADGAEDAGGEEGADEGAAASRGPTAAAMLAAMREHWGPPLRDRAGEASSVPPWARDSDAGASADGESASASADAPPLAPSMDTFVETLRRELPTAEAALDGLKAQHQVTSIKLHWAQQRPSVRPGSADRPSLRDRVFGLRGMCEELVSHMLDLVMLHISQRPSVAEVAAEVAVWRAARPGALLAIARHVAQSLVWEVVDEMVAEAHEETAYLAQVADTFAFDMLVEAVAYSQRKYDFGPGDDNVRARLREAAAAQEAHLAKSIAAKRAATNARTMTRAVTLARATGGQGAQSTAVTAADFAAAAVHDDGGGGGDGRDDDDAAASYLLYGGQMAGASRAIKVGAALDEELDDEAIYVMQRQFDTHAGRRDEKQLYLQGLKAMLQEMRLRRADSPYGHTQQLSPYWPPYVRVTRAQRLAAQRLRPPLAAGPAVWRRRVVERTSRAPHGPWPRPEHLAAATRERTFWAKVALVPTYLAPKGGTMVQVFRELGPITATSVSPNGALLAVGTAPGATLVFDMRGKAAAPWFQVLGNGQTYKRPWFRRRKPSNPSIVAFAWSGDSYQLASLDASSTLRVWWMRPEPGAIIKEDPGRLPVAPELAVSIGPLNMMLSGKAPIPEPMLEEAGAWAAVAPSTAGDGAGAAAAAAAAAAALARRWSVCFQPEFNIAGVQPTVLLPQITGDIVRVTTTLGAAVLPTPLPRSRVRQRPLLSQQTVEYLLPPQIASSEVRSQALLRGHDAPLVYIGVTGDCASVVSVDQSGEVNLWPTYEGDRTGYGWFRPRATWHMPRSLRSLQARGPLHPVWPRTPEPALQGLLYNPPPPSVIAGIPRGGFFSALRGGGRAASGADMYHAAGAGGPADPLDDPATLDAVAAVLGAPPATFNDLLNDAGMLDDDHEAARLEKQPTGDFLLATRTLWMIRFVADRQGRVLRESIHRPAASDGSGVGNRPLVVSTFTLSGELVRRAKQYAVNTQLPYRVVAAELTPSRRDLVVWCRVAPSAGDVDSFAYFSVHVLNVEGGFKANTPRVEVYDHSRGSAPPAFAVSPRVPGLGSEYLIVGLGHGLLGLYSLATGAMMRALPLPGVPTFSRYFASLSLWTVAHHAGWPSAGKSFVAVTPANGLAVLVYELDDDAGVQQEVEGVAALGPPPGLLPLPASRPIDLPCTEPAPVAHNRWAGSRDVVRTSAAGAAGPAAAAPAAAAAAAAAAPPAPAQTSPSKQRTSGAGASPSKHRTSVERRAAAGAPAPDAAAGAPAPDAAAGPAAPPPRLAPPGVLASARRSSGGGIAPAPSARNVQFSAAPPQERTLPPLSPPQDAAASLSSPLLAPQRGTAGAAAAAAAAAADTPSAGPAEPPPWSRALSMPASVDSRTDSRRFTWDDEGPHGRSLQRTMTGASSFGTTAAMEAQEAAMEAARLARGRWKGGGAAGPARK